MAAIDAVHRSSKPLPSPRSTLRNMAPTSKTRRVPVNVDESDDEDVASHAEIDEAEPVDAFTLVPHVAEQTLHAVHSAIFGQPWADLEFVVSTGGKKEEVIYANSKILKRACPALYRQVSTTGRCDLDTMEREQIIAAAVNAAATKKGAATAKHAAPVHPQAAQRKSTDGLGLVNYAQRDSRTGAKHNQNHDDDDDDDEEELDERHREFDDEEEYSDSLVEQPRVSLHDDQDDERFDADDVEEASPLGSKSKVAGVSAAVNSIPAPPTFSRSSSRFSKLMKGFMNKDKPSPSAEVETALPFSSIGNASGTDYRNNDASVAARSRVRRYSAANDLVTSSNARGPEAARVQVTGCSAATLQALIFYLYTGHATFASRLPVTPTRRQRRGSASSLDSDRADSIARSDESDDNEQPFDVPTPRTNKNSSFPPVFSATAAYCVGRQLGLRDLTTKAFDHICLELSPKTVLADLLSPFVDRFDEVQRAHLDYIAENWDRVKRRPDFELTVGRLVAGEYKESRKALLKLFAKLSVA
ncbi:hypothetical protein PHBOTO_003457 [Pseudozyma hubeiensis]|nr:hypothetical protein PHBOTO_003457 [Pseudozyma hubeiensis]